VRPWKCACTQPSEPTTISFLKKKFPELFSLFDYPVFSFETHSIKPQESIYLHALNLAKTPPYNIVFIDDKIEYVKAAKKLGIHAFKYTTIISFKENLKILGLI
jgi:FMN phosphatase YigB (HAD superfamily)